eukprot:scaffold195_cov161-Skeletonema_menzelii.AAC.10
MKCNTTYSYVGDKTATREPTLSRFGLIDEDDGTDEKPSSASLLGSIVVASHVHVCTYYLTSRVERSTDNRTPFAALIRNVAIQTNHNEVQCSSHVYANCGNYSYL